MKHSRPSDAVRSLISKLSLEQKVAQLAGMLVTDLVGPPTQPGERFGLDVDRLATIRPHGLGHLSMAWFLGPEAERFRSGLERIQAAVRDLTPFGIGVLVHNEAISGFLHESGEQFPTAWAQAATWEPALVTRAAAVSAAHMRETGVHIAFSPLMDLSRDPRWGRVHETYGEDPELVSQIAVAFVRGIQGNAAEPTIFATGKHFVGYGASEGGLNQAITQLGRRAIVDEYAEPFRRAIAETGLSVVMNSYNEIDGVPSVADRWLLTDLLRGQLGFDGMVVGDYDAVTMLRTVYHSTTTEGETAARALAAGLDSELPGNPNYAHLADEVRAGRIDEKFVDLAVARVLDIKERVGLIASSARPACAAAPPDAAEAASVRRSLAERGLILLKNDGILPLVAEAQRIVVVGPAADELRIHFGAYTSVSNSEMQIGARALRAGQIPGIDPATFVFTDIFQARMPGIEPQFEATTRSLHPQARTVVEGLRARSPSVAFARFGGFGVESDTTLDIPALEAAVAGADVVIAVVGERTGWVGNNTAGEGQSTAVPELPGDQNALIDALARTGKALVTVVISGRPLLLENVAKVSSALVLSPLLGEASGEVIAAALFGAFNPSGKLPSTFPRSLGQIPIYHGHHYGSGYDHPTGSRHGYGDLADQSPLFPFGHGLSYTRFGVAFASNEDPPQVVDGVIRVGCNVSNLGSVDGETVVQLYARDEAASIVRPVRQLLAFARVFIESNGSRFIQLEAPVERLHYTMLDGIRGIEAGDIRLMIGFSSTDLRCEATIRVGASMPEIESTGMVKSER